MLALLLRFIQASTYCLYNITTKKYCSCNSNHTTTVVKGDIFAIFAVASAIAVATVTVVVVRQPDDK